MPHKVQAVVVRAMNGPLSLETILVPDPGPGEALVDILTCGVCHTDLHYQKGGISDNYPFLLGHEATGVVAELVITTRFCSATRPPASSRRSVMMSPMWWWGIGSS